MRKRFLLVVLSVGLYASLVIVLFTYEGGILLEPLSIGPVVAGFIIAFFLAVTAFLWVKLRRRAEIPRAWLVFKTVGNLFFIIAAIAMCLLGLSAEISLLLFVAACVLWALGIGKLLRATKH